jgi:hypothetical protein
MRDEHLVEKLYSMHADASLALRIVAEDLSGTSSHNYGASSLSSLTCYVVSLTFNGRAITS